MQRIRRKTALSDSLLIVRVETEGGPQAMPALTLDVLPGWLFGIDENRVKPEVRADVILFQRECVRVLAEHFARKAQPALPASAALVPSEPMREPVAPERDAPREAWRAYHQATIKHQAARLHELSGLAYATIYGELTAAFHVGKYSDIADVRWPEIAAWSKTRIEAAEQRDGRR